MVSQLGFLLAGNRLITGYGHRRPARRVVVVHAGGYKLTGMGRKRFGRPRSTVYRRRTYRPRTYRPRTRRAYTRKPKLSAAAVEHIIEAAAPAAASEPIITIEGGRYYRRSRAPRRRLSDRRVHRAIRVRRMF